METANGFYWERQPEAEKACLALLGDCLRENSMLARFHDTLVRKTSSRMLDWVDHFLLPGSGPAREKLEALGFVKQPETRQNAFYHPGALLPKIVLMDSAGPARGVALRVENIGDFLQLNGFHAEVEGGPLGPYRRATVNREGGVSFLAVQRSGTADYEPVDPPDAYLRTVLKGIETCQNRARGGQDENDLFEDVVRISGMLIDNLGPHAAAHILCMTERSYWLARNFAAQLQKSRQDSLGLGWGNQDHLTFRSSRRNFGRLVSLFSRLGFINRERFYAGAEARWGAQVMENPVAGITLFLDVDLAPEEVDTDFSREELAPRDQLGTVGLWCALHGDSILQAGLHHAAARFDFERLIGDLAQYGVAYMPPFSNFPYLKQAFSVAGRWQVDPIRVNNLVVRKSITDEQGEQFLSQGAVGSHLENIDRREGYKGFNKKNVSAIIRDTDPRKHLV